MDLSTLLTANPSVFPFVAALLGLLVGSFLNVVIYRLPLMMEKAWKSECEEFLGRPRSEAEAPPFNLIGPRSHCPKCGHLVRAHENIPVVSYLLLGGRCVQCKSPISIRYPVIEILSAVLSGIVAWRFGASWQAGAALALTWALICLSAIDLDKFLLPDGITFPFIWIGLLLSLFELFTDSHSGIIGAVAGYLSLWSVYQLFRLLTGKEGMGHGDFKLLAMFGAWLGWSMLLPLILLSSLVGALVGTCMIVFFRHDRSRPIPFGPYLCAAGWICMLWGHELISWYLKFAGLSS